jgi:hypothetical protein
MFGDETGSQIRYAGGAPTCGSFPCFNVFNLSFTGNGFPLNFEFSQQLQSVGSGSSTTPIFDVSTKIDRIFAGVPNGSAGQVRTYSNNLLSNPGPWVERTNLRFPPSGSSYAGSRFGASVAASGDFVLVSDPTGAAGGQVHQYQISHGSNPNDITQDSYFEIGMGGQSFGTAIALDGLCGAIGIPSSNAVELFPINNPTPTITTSSNGVTVIVPAIGMTGSVSLTVDPTCEVDFANVLEQVFSHTCAGATSSVEILGAATVCFPDNGPGNNAVYRCDPQVGQCVAPSRVRTVKALDGTIKGIECCVPLPTGQIINGQYCVPTTGFSQFANAARYVDTDSDGWVDLADNCPTASNFFQDDTDNDLIGDVCDNCPGVPNQDQKNTTGASVGDACNCALPGVKKGPTGAACPARSVPAMPAPMTGLLGGLMLSLGIFAVGGGRKLFRA